jgi:hypothetical protein
MKNATALLVAILLCAPSGWGQVPRPQRERPAEAREPVPSELPGEPDADDPGLLPDFISVPAGTHLPLIIVRSPQESQAREGDKVYLRMRSPLRAGGRVLFPAKTLVVGVLSSDPGFGAAQGHGTMSLRLHTIILANNDRVALSGRVAGNIEPSRGASPTPLAAGVVPVPVLTQEQLSTVGSFALVGGALGLAVGKNPKGATIGALVGAGIGVAAMLASNGSRLHLSPGTCVDAVLDQPLALEDRPNQ